MQRLIERLRAIAPPNGLLLNEPMSLHTTFRIGGPADIVFFPDSAQSLAQAMALAREENVPCFVMGNGSNILVRDGGLRGLVIILGEGMSRVAVDGCLVRAQAGAPLARVCREAQKAALSGLAFASGIPGSVGGAVAMNAGAYGGEISGVLKRALVLSGSRAEWKTPGELHMGYRSTDVLRDGLIVLEAEFALEPGNAEAILEEMNELNRRRREKQPVHLPSAGSTFKRPEGYFAGALIQEAGLKGYAVGDAQVSPLHAGFVVNNGRATARDVLRLIADVQSRVRETSGVTLETEIRIMGEEE